MQKTYAEKRFGPKKEAIENKNAASVQTRGGWFGFTHVSVLTHYNRFKNILRAKSPFLIAEIDPNTAKIIHTEVSKINDTRIHVIDDDLFDKMFNMYPSSASNCVNGTTKYRVPLFSYGHLDFCRTAATLSDCHIEANIRKLAKWWALKDTFYLDISVCLRGDKGTKSAETLMEKYIPNAFRQLNWKMNYDSKIDYNDSNIMRNAFYEFRRAVPWNKSGRNCYVDEEL